MAKRKHRTREFSERGRRAARRQVSQHESAWFALRCNDWFGLRQRLATRFITKLLSMKTRSASQLSHNIQSSIGGIEQTMF